MQVAENNVREIQSKRPRVIEMIYNHCRVMDLSRKTAKAYSHWVDRFSRFNDRRPLSEMGGEEIERFITHLAVDLDVASSTQDQAFYALLFFYENIVKKEIGQINSKRATKPRKIPVVFTKEEAIAVRAHLSGLSWLQASLLHGCGLRIAECLAMRVQDVDFGASMITVRSGKGDKDRTVMLPSSVVEPLQRQINAVRGVYDQDQQNSIGVTLPRALARKYKNAPFEWKWFFVFPASRTTRENPKLRHHTHETVLQKHLRKAVSLAGINKKATCHTFRHSFATHLLMDGYDIRTVADLMGHRDIRTTMIYLHTIRNSKVRSPID